jgi:ATP-dependent DNA helicase RecG
MTNRKKPDPRELMEMAIRVMQQSVHEPRKDNKKSPSVGAVLLKCDGTIETGCRGELRHGDHAEFTLLERKNRTSKLDGSILFTTLEPCAPGARRHPKLGCAERIVLARIKEVWVGVEDPDPTVDRKGIRYLEENNIAVHMFDRDLQKRIMEENREFFAQARKRAEGEKKPKKITLSTFEDAVATANLEDFSKEALEQFRTKAGIKHAIGSDSFSRILLQQGLLQKQDGRLLPNGFGILLFGKNPRNIFRQAGILGTIHYAAGEPEIREFNKPIVLIPNLVEEWLKKALPLTIDRSGMERKETPAFPLVLVREAVVNALIHRDYDIAGAKCQLGVTDDAITVKSPGYPVSPIKLEDLQSFNAPALSRNPEIHFVFAQMNMAEERGLGMETWKTLPEKYGLPLPKYTFEDPYVVLTLYRSEKGVKHALDPEVLAAMNEDEKAGWLFLASKTETTMREYADHMRFEHRKAQRHLKRFVEFDLLERIGAGPATKYRVLRR